MNFRPAPDDINAVLAELERARKVREKMQPVYEEYAKLVKDCKVLQNRVVAGHSNFKIFNVFLYAIVGCIPIFIVLFLIALLILQKTIGESWEFTDLTLSIIIATAFGIADEINSMRKQRNDIAELHELEAQLAKVEEALEYSYIDFGDTFIQQEIFQNLKAIEFLIKQIRTHRATTYAEALRNMDKHEQFKQLRKDIANRPVVYNYYTYNTK